MEKWNKWQKIPLKYSNNIEVILNCTKVQYLAKWTAVIHLHYFLQNSCSVSCTRVVSFETEVKEDVRGVGILHTVPEKITDS